jgi:PKD repeat protein
VILSADIGTVAQDNTVGTWSWTTPTNDGPDGPTTVTITATDNFSETATTSFSFTVDNVAPSVGIEHISRTINEGDTATNRGTWSDAGLDVVTLTASAGSVTQNDDGNWSWIYGSNDGPDNSQSVTITATDSDGAATSTTFELTVDNVAPQNVYAGADQTVNEGDVMNLSGSFNDPGSADTHTRIWNVVASNGQIIPDGSGDDFSFMPNDNGIYTVTFIVTDDDLGGTRDTMMVTVDNMAPDVNAGVDQMSHEGGIVNFAGSFTDAGSADTHTLAWDFGDGGTANGTETTSHVYADNGSYTATFCVTDDEGANTCDTLTVTVTNVAPSVSVSLPSQVVQYSDPIEVVTIEAADVAADSLDASTQWNMNGGEFASGLPDALSIAGGLTFSGSGGPGTGTWTITGIADLEPATYVIRVQAADGDGGATSRDITLIVNQEDARAYFTGLNYVTTGSASSSTATVILSATIKDITAVNSSTDSRAGDIRKATATFIDRDSGTVIAAGLPVNLITSGDPTVGTVTFKWSANIGSAEAKSFTIGTIVDNWYTRNSTLDDTVIEVAKPVPGSINGGGYLVNTNSAGVYAGQVGEKTDFGFNVKFNKKLTNLQGHSNIIFPSSGRVYQIKNNATDSLNLQTLAGGVFKATFTSKANLTDITDPTAPISLGGNKTLQIQMTDNGEPGSSDMIAITLSDSSGLLFSSRWNGTQSVEQLLGGGNLQVRPAQVLDDSSVGGGLSGSIISTSDVEDLLPAALEWWRTQGIDPVLLQPLAHVEMVIDDFSDAGLAWAMPGVITIDRDAAGRGWFVDPTPDAHEEFISGVGHGPADGSVDLLSVLTHELGHLIGRNELFGDSDDIMEIALSAGTRRMIGEPSDDVRPEFRTASNISGSGDWNRVVDSVFVEFEAETSKTFAVTSPLLSPKKRIAQPSWQTGPDTTGDQSATIQRAQFGGSQRTSLLGAEGGQESHFDVPLDSDMLAAIVAERL